MSKLAVYSAKGPYALDVVVSSRNGETHSLLGRLSHTAFEDRLEELVHEALETWLTELIAAEKKDG